MGRPPTNPPVPDLLRKELKNQMPCLAPRALLGTDYRTVVPILAVTRFGVE